MKQKDVKLFVKTPEFDQICSLLENNVSKIPINYLVPVLKNTISLSSEKTRSFIGRRFEFIIDKICLFMLKNQQRGNFFGVENEESIGNISRQAENENSLKNVDILSQEELFFLMRLLKKVLKVCFVYCIFILC